MSRFGTGDAVITSESGVPFESTSNIDRGMLRTSR